MTDKISEIRNAIETSVIITRPKEYISYLLSELDAAKTDSKKWAEQSRRDAVSVYAIQQQLDTAKKQLKNTTEAWEEQKEEIRSLRAGYTSANARRDEELYFWVPYAENHLETLTGGVVIRAEWIRQLIQEAVKQKTSELDTTKVEKETLLESFLSCDRERSRLCTSLEAAKQENERYRLALEEIKDEEWRLAGEFTTIYTAAYQALYMAVGDDEKAETLSLIREEANPSTAPGSA